MTDKSSDLIFVFFGKVFFALCVTLATLAAAKALFRYFDPLQNAHDDLVPHVTQDFLFPRPFVEAGERSREARRNSWRRSGSDREDLVLARAS